MKFDCAYLSYLSVCGDRECGCAEGELSPDWLCSQLSLHFNLFICAMGTINN